MLGFGLIAKIGKSLSSNQLANSSFPDTPVFSPKLVGDSHVETDWPQGLAYADVKLESDNGDEASSIIPHSTIQILYLKTSLPIPFLLSRSLVNVTCLASWQPLSTTLSRFENTLR